MVRAFTFMTMLKLLITILFSASLSAYAQDISFPINEIGKYEFNEVVELNKLDKDKLFLNGQKFMEKIKILHSKKKFYKEEKENYTIKNRGSFYVYRLGSIKKRIGGAVEYDLTLEIKDEKYRYTLTNFIFNEYQKNRYGKYEPIKGKYTPLEAQASSLNKKEWDKQRQVVFDKSQELIQNLYSNMIYAEEKKKKKDKKDDNW